jgi:hypothetical protein
MSISNTKELNSLVSSTFVARAAEVDRSNPTIQDKDTINFRNLSDQSRDVYNPVEYHSMVKYCYALWLNNPLAFSAIEIILDFALGDSGIEYDAKDDAVQECLDEFVKMNNMQKKCKQRLRDKLINGELCLVANTSAYSGKVKLGWKDPKQINELAVDEIDNEDIVAITFNGDDKPYYVVKLNPFTGKYEGDIFYYQINKVGGQTRGLSDLFQSRDWLQKYDDILDGIQKYLDALTKIIWDIELEGAEEDELRNRNTQLKKDPPQKKSWVLHNENEKWKLNTPNTQGSNFNEIDGIFKGMAIVGLREPIHFFGSGDGDTTKATALSMNSPFYRKIKSRQADEVQMYREMGQFVIDTAKNRGMLSPGVEEAFNVKVPEPDKELLIKMSDVLGKVADALTTLRIEGHISDDVAKTVSDMLIGHLGIDIQENDNPATTSAELNTMNSKIYNLMAQAMKKLQNTGKTKPLDINN